MSATPSRRCWGNARLEFDPESLVGTYAGDYLLDSVRAVTVDGVVYATHDARHGHPVSVKVLRGPRPGPRFERVSAVVRGIECAYVARLHATMRLPGGMAALVYERAGGRDLVARLREGPIGLTEGLRVLEQLLDALEECHKVGIVHRDLRPEAVRLRPRLGRPGNDLKVENVGLAQMLSERAAPVVGELLYGHPLFTAPEQWVNREVDGATDLYAVGLLGLVLFRGRHFIEPGPPLDVCAQHFRAPRPLLRETAGGEPTPPALGDLLRKAAHPDRERRFQTVAEMRHAVGRARAALPRNPTGPIRQSQPILESLQDPGVNPESSVLDEIAAAATSWDPFSSGDDER